MSLTPQRRLTSHQLHSLYNSICLTTTYEGRVVAYGDAVQSWLLNPDAEDPRLPLSALGLPRRIYNALIRAGYTAVDEVRGASDARLLSVRGLGRKGLSILRQALSGGTSTGRDS